MNARRRLGLAAGLGAGLFLLYMASMPPGLAPYRDAGEFSVAAHTLGVAHPPSYPLYVLIGRVFDLLPWATTDYRLGLLSALSAAGTAAALAWLAGAAGPAAALTAGLAFGLDAVPWSVAMVQEMYALMALQAAVLLAAASALGEAWSTRAWLGACFFYGLSLGNRTDLILWAPGLVVLAWPLGVSARARNRLLVSGALLALAGLSVYLFLPVRSATGPWLDWNHPATLDNFLGSLARRGYGGTLDLLSESYRTGENFPANMLVYWRHLLSDVGPPAALLAAGGAVVLARRRPRVLAGTALLYLLSGPFFLFLANMPPNPHALAIVQPHYMLSDMVLALWAAEAVAAAAAAPAAPWVAGLLAGAVAAAPFVQGRFARMDRRWDLFVHDWADSALRSAPPGSVLVAKKDVQIFGLWHHQLVLGRRPDVASLAEGLAHTPWHEEALRRAGANVVPMGLRTPEEWRAFLAANPETWVTMDAEVPASIRVGPPRGIDAPVPARALVGPDPGPFVVLRGDARYEERPDFFSADLVESYAAARQRRGAILAGLGDYAGARRELMGAWSLKYVMPEAADFLGFIALSSGDYAGAVSAFEAAARLYDKTLAYTVEYNSLPETRRSIADSAAESAVNMGVAYERVRRPDLAEAAYRRALRLKPGLARAHFNIAVLYWGRDWRRAEDELEQALAADPGFAQAARYLGAARAHLAAGR